MALTIGNVIGIPFRRRYKKGLSPALKAKFLALGDFEIVSGELINILGTGNLVVTGTEWAGKIMLSNETATIAIPNDADFIAADGTDAFWYDSTIQQKTAYELISTFNSRTFIKYTNELNDDDLHELSYWGILKDGETLTQTDENNLSAYFDLDVYYFGYLNDYGVIKERIIQDYDGNVYGTVKIGDQIWLTENLKTTHYNNGDVIPNTYYPNNDINNVDYFGMLYRLDSINNAAGMCPAGYRLPTYEDFQILRNYVIQEAGNSLCNHLMSTSLDAWINPGNDRFGFDGRGSGYQDFASMSFFKTTVQFIGSDFGRIYLARQNNIVVQTVEEVNRDKYAFSIRCIKA